MINEPSRRERLKQSLAAKQEETEAKNAVRKERFAAAQDERAQHRADLKDERAQATAARKAERDDRRAAAHLERQAKAQAKLEVIAERKSAGLPRAGYATFTNARYLGGLGGRVTQGNLYINQTTIGIGTLKPKIAIVNWADVEWVDVEDDEVRRSRAGKVVLLGPLALLTRSKEQMVDITVHLKDGRNAMYQMKKAKENAFQVRAKIDPFVRAAGAGWRDEAASFGQAAEVGVDIPAQISALAQLRDAGALTEEEFTTKKAELLGRM